jgi:hypothetical protein
MGQRMMRCFVEQTPFRHGSRSPSRALKTSRTQRNTRCAARGERPVVVASRQVPPVGDPCAAPTPAGTSARCAAFRSTWGRQSHWVRRRQSLQPRSRRASSPLRPAPQHSRRLRAGVPGPKEPAHQAESPVGVRSTPIRQPPGDRSRAESSRRRRSAPLRGRGRRHLEGQTYRNHRQGRRHGAGTPRRPAVSPAAHSARDHQLPRVVDYDSTRTPGRGTTAAEHGCGWATRQRTYRPARRLRGTALVPSASGASDGSAVGPSTACEAQPAAV